MFLTVCGTGHAAACKELLLTGFHRPARVMLILSTLTVLLLLLVICGLRIIREKLKFRHAINYIKNFILFSES